MNQSSFRHSIGEMLYDRALIFQSIAHGRDLEKTTKQYLLKFSSNFTSSQTSRKHIGLYIQPNDRLSDFDKLEV